MVESDEEETPSSAEIVDMTGSRTSLLPKILAQEIGKNTMWLLVHKSIDILLKWLETSLFFILNRISMSIFVVGCRPNNNLTLFKYPDAGQTKSNEYESNE